MIRRSLILYISWHDRAGHPSFSFVWQSRRKVKGEEARLRPIGERSHFNYGCEPLSEVVLCVEGGEIMKDLPDESP